VSESGNADAGLIGPHQQIALRRGDFDDAALEGLALALESRLVRLGLGPEEIDDLLAYLKSFE
jgi:hypothetical protein